MGTLQNVERVSRPLNIVEKTVVGTAILMTSGLALAAEPAAPDTASIVTYAGLIIAAVGVVGAAILMIPLAAKGFKWIKSAF